MLCRQQADASVAGARRPTWASRAKLPSGAPTAPPSPPRRWCWWRTRCPMRRPRARAAHSRLRTARWTPRGTACAERQLPTWHCQSSYGCQNGAQSAQRGHATRVTSPCAACASGVRPALPCPGRRPSGVRCALQGQRRRLMCASLGASRRRSLTTAAAASLMRDAPAATLLRLRCQYTRTWAASGAQSALTSRATPSPSRHAASAALPRRTLACWSITQRGFKAPSGATSARTCLRRL
mmetsp:Transcript_20896/g.54581  ORF Transcript_20896/g.54581 Transcript_20896/m.54581 type:complete len:239 (-) Transcript_20896:103-819(-)